MPLFEPPSGGDSAESGKEFKERVNAYSSQREDYKNAVVKKEPFMSDDIYRICRQIWELSVRLYMKSEIKMSGRKVDWQEIDQLNDKSDALLAKLKSAIRQSLRLG
ncbi:hypothetical protein SynA1528_01970 [Synechococcus sp. A15-28]|nr:hypothetical protein SynA1528_01970 [Synechococcus sp. A15-28]